MNKLKLLLGKLFLEGVAVFLAVTAAFFLDKKQDTDRIKMEEKAYLGILYAQVANDIVYLIGVEQGMKEQQNSLDSLLKNKPNSKLYIDNIFLYEPPIEVFTAMINSNAFNDLYDSTLYYAINDQMRDFKLIASIEKKTDELQEICINEYVFPFRDVNNEMGSLKSSKSHEWNNLKLNRLRKLNELFQVRYTTIYSIHENYRKIFRRISTMKKERNRIARISLNSPLLFYEA